MPVVLRRALGHLPAPSTVCRDLGKTVTLGDLDYSVWDSCDELTTQARNDLVRICSACQGDIADLLITDDFVSNQVELDSLMISGSTMAALRKSFDSSPVSLQGLTFGALLSMRNIGMRRALELSAALEQRNSGAAGRSARVPPELGEFFASISEWAAHELGESQLGDLLPDADDRWPQAVVDSWSQLRSVNIESSGRTTDDSENVTRLMIQVLSRCGDHVIVVMKARVLAISEPTRLEVLSAALGETPQRLLELEAIARQTLQRFDAEAYRPVMRRAEKIRARIGSAAPADDVAIDRALDWAASDFNDPQFRELAREVFLWLAGPYQRHQGWLLSGANLVGRTADAIIEHRYAENRVATAELQDTLCEIGIRPSYHERWIDWVVDVARIASGRAPRKHGVETSTVTRVA